MPNQELEQYIIQTFKEYYENFPAGILIQGEKPDFTITDGDKVIGIEIAEVFQDSHLDKGSQLKRQEVTEDKFEKSLLKAIKNHTEKNIAIGVDFSTFHSFTVNEIDALVQECLPHPLEFIWNNNEGSERIINHPSMFRFPLPKEVNSIWIYILSPEVPSFNTQSQGGTVSNLELQHIEPTLLKHQKAKAKYKPCDEYWLLIREGNYHAGSFSNVVIETPIESTFDKVFILRTRKQGVVELK